MYVCMHTCMKCQDWTHLDSGNTSKELGIPDAPSSKCLQSVVCVVDKCTSLLYSEQLQHNSFQE